MVLFSLGVIGQKYHSDLKYCFPYDFSRYLLSGFLILRGLFLKTFGLGAEFNFVSNGAIQTRGHRTKTSASARNTGFPGDFRSITCPDSLY